MNVPEELKAGRTWVCGGLGIGLPGLSFFTTYVPPLFPIISLITALPAAILLFVFALRSGPDRRRGGLPRDETRAAYFVAGGLTLVVLYLLFFLYTTIPSPTGERLQIGFGLSPWSLTEAGQSWVKSQPTITVVEMVKREAAFEQDRLFILWKSWSIYLAGVLVFLFYLLGFISWTSGFAFLAKRQSLPDKAAEG